MASLLTRIGEAELARMMLEWPRFPLEAEVLAAPDLEAALRALVTRVDGKNPTVSITMADENGRLVIAICVHPDLGPFRALYEQISLIWIFLVIRSFLGMSSDGRNLLGRVAIGRFHSDTAVDALLHCRTIKPEDAAMLIVPSEALRCVGPDFKPELWQATQAALEAATRKDTQGSNVGETIAGSVNGSLRDYGRVPTFDQIAQSIGRSQRTLARNLAEAGTSYREIVDTVRMKMAREMLSNGDVSVREISAKLGYSDDTAFVRAFRRHFGLSPTNWLRQAPTQSRARRS